ncbi:MAG TPA: protein phosphatase CheZ [Bacteroidota bacterium]|nr:protein phosphatase CheZ [Bacteroidota bacterium]
MENGTVHTFSKPAASVPPVDHRSSMGFDENDIGVIEDFIQHVRGVIPLLENVKNSIEESSSRIPKASMQLSKVTEATESATVEILNVVEAVTAQIEQSAKQLNDVKSFVLSASQVPGNEEAVKAIASIEKTLSETKDNSMNIAIALQVQDITSQQIAGVSHTIESIRQQLFHALRRFEDPADESAAGAGTGEASAAQAKHFDGDANFTKAPDRQDLADEIIKQWNQNKAV